jgi:hypothetical protein
MQERRADEKIIAQPIAHTQDIFTLLRDGPVFPL